jgi:hypothetical protein
MGGSVEGSYPRGCFSPACGSPFAHGSAIVLTLCASECMYSSPCVSNIGSDQELGRLALISQVALCDKTRRSGMDEILLCVAFAYVSMLVGATIAAMAGL